MDLRAAVKQPEYGSDDYKNQVLTMYKVISTSDCTRDEVDKFLMPYIMDMSYHRAAIAEARKRLLREHFKEKTI